MIELSSELLLPIIHRARLAPSVHNVQPSRWRIENNRLLLLGDPTRAIPVADPGGRDWRLSHGASIEGLSLALGQKGLKLSDIDIRPTDAPKHISGLSPIAEMSVVSTKETQQNCQAVRNRVSWRGKFKPVDPETNKSLSKLGWARKDCRLIRDRQELNEVAVLADQAGMFSLRGKAHRHEWLEWMRLSKSHDRYNIDGLNAAAMNMSAPKAWGAGLVLGPMFAALDTIGLAKPLIGEARKNKSAAAFVLFHRPIGEDALNSGRALYQAWLAMERLGLRGCPVSVLAGWSHSKDILAKRFDLPSNREIISVFRVGKPVKAPVINHVRLPATTLLV